MAKQAKVEVTTVHHEDGGFTHTLKFTNGHIRIWSVAPDHELYGRYAAAGAKGKALAAINSADDSDTAVQKFDALVNAADEGKWSLVGEGGPKFTPLVRAYAEVAGIEPEAADARIKGMSKSEQARLRTAERLVPLIAKFKKEDGDTEGDDFLKDLLKKEEPEDRDASERVA